MLKWLCAKAPSLFQSQYGGGPVSQNQLSTLKNPCIDADAVNGQSVVVYHIKVQLKSRL